MVTEDDAQALVLRVFASYLSLMRRVQTTYWCGTRTMALPGSTTLASEFAPHTLIKHQPVSARINPSRLCP